MKPFRYLSVCSGIEAASVAWEPLGWQAAAFSEIEPFPRAVLAHRFPGVPLHGDFTTIEGDEYGPIDLLVGGTPCQSFSVAGLRGGLDDDRGNLALEFLKLAGRARPRWVVWENVPGVLSSNGGRDFGAILGGLVEFGYGFAYRVLDAQYFGVPQRRRRVFVVGYLGDWRRAAAVLFEPHGLSGHPAPRRQAGQGVAALTADGVGTCGADDNQGQAGHLIAFGGNDTRGPIDVATACNAKGGTGRGDFESETFVAHALRGEGFDASEDGTGRGTPIVPVMGVDCYNGAITGDVAATLGTQSGDGVSSGPSVMVPMAFSAKDHGADAGETAPTLRAGGHRNSHANAGVMPAVALASDVRRLTPRECERLQGFPDDWTFVPFRRRMAADGPRYKAIGNSKAVPVVRWIGRRIERVRHLEFA